jgi:hypothetical protein
MDFLLPGDGVWVLPNVGLYRPDGTVEKYRSEGKDVK